MAEIVAIVPSEGIEETGQMRWSFLFDANLPPDLLERVVDRPFGFLLRTSEEEAGSISQEGIKRWMINVFGHQGPILASVAGEALLPKLLEPIPDCNLLVAHEAIEPLSIACTGIGHQIVIHQYEGRLSTGYL